MEQVTRIADAAIVGSEVVNAIANSLDADGKAKPETIQTTLSLVRDLAAGCEENKFFRESKIIS